MYKSPPPLEGMSEGGWFTFLFSRILEPQYIPYNMYTMLCYHDDIIKWKYFPRYWPFVTGHQWIPLTKASDAGLMFSLICALNKRLSKQLWGWWFETPSHSLWRHCNVFFVVKVKFFIGWCDFYSPIEGLVQDCSNSSALALELLQSCAKLSFASLPLGQCLMDMEKISWYLNTSKHKTWRVCIICEMHSTLTY